MTHEINFRQVILESITRANGLESGEEEELMLMITNEVTKRSKKISFKSVDDLKLETLKTEEDTKEVVENGVYVYCNNSLLDWTYERFETIADAIKKAVRCINAYIICNGNTIKYDALDDNTAYYYDNGTMKIVNFGE